VTVGHRVRIEIVEIMGGGSCPAGLSVGDVWEISDGMTPSGMCSSAWNSIMPFVTTLRFGGRFPWREEPWVRLCCPDADNPVVFRVERVE
jgi:uncharacterized repeat protein (TIGR04076 family)